MNEDKLAPKVLNKRQLYHRFPVSHGIPPSAIYVGRPTKWGNPFEINSATTREQVIEQYRDWLLYSNEGLILLHRIKDLRGHDLVCWCAPLPCHADLLLELANE